VTNAWSFGGNLDRELFRLVATTKINHEGRMEEIFVFFVPSWFIFRKSLHVASRGNNDERAFRVPPLGGRARRQSN
jgi:hypothetical protein